MLASLEATKVNDLEHVMKSHTTTNALTSPNESTQLLLKAGTTDESNASKKNLTVNQYATTESESRSASLAQTEPYPEAKETKEPSTEPCLVTVSPLLAEGTDHQEHEGSPQQDEEQERTTATDWSMHTEKFEKAHAASIQEKKEQGLNSNQRTALKREQHMRPPIKIPRLHTNQRTALKREQHIRPPIKIPRSHTNQRTAIEREQHMRPSIKILRLLTNQHTALEREQHMRPPIETVRFLNSHPQLKQTNKCKLAWKTECQINP